MASYNHVTLLGNVTRDIQVRHTQGGTAVCEVGMAMNDKYKSKDGVLVDKPVFADVTLWGRLAEIAAEYLKKGSPVLIAGKLAFDQWEKDGVKHSKLKVVGESLQLLGGNRRDSSDQTPSSYSGEESQASHNGFDGTGSVDPTGDIPF